MRLPARPATLAPLVLALELASIAPAAGAAEGVLEISQACAVQTGCFPGDTAGFPVTISQAGSYRLTGNLDVGSADGTAIVVESPAVSLDLAGFTLSGPVSCTGSGATLSCVPSGGSGLGVEFLAVAHGGAVAHGTIRGFGSQGISGAARGLRVDAVTAMHNGSDGIAAQEHALVRDCVAIENRSDGFDLDAGSVLDGATSAGNGLDGVEIDGPGGLVTHTTSHGNGGAGFNLAPGARFVANVSRDNALADLCSGACSEPPPLPGPGECPCFTLSSLNMVLAPFTGTADLCVDSAGDTRLGLGNLSVGAVNNCGVLHPQDPLIQIELPVDAAQRLACATLIRASDLWQRSCP